MSLRSLKIPGSRLGLGTFVNSDIDAKRKIVFFGTTSFAKTVHHVTFTQGHTRMATIQTVLTSWANWNNTGSASFQWGYGTISGGSVTLRNKVTAALANTGDTAGQVHFWMCGSPDPDRIVV